MPVSALSTRRALRDRPVRGLHRRALNIRASHDVGADPLGDAGDERAAAIAWLRLWVYGDQADRAYFYGDNCKLCQSPWVNAQRKNWR